MIFVLMIFGAGMARLRSVAIVFSKFVYHLRMKGREQSDLGIPTER